MNISAYDRLAFLELAVLALYSHGDALGRIECKHDVAIDPGVGHDRKAIALQDHRDGGLHGHDRANARPYVRVYVRPPLSSSYFLLLPF